MSEMGNDEVEDGGNSDAMPLEDLKALIDAGASGTPTPEPEPAAVPEAPPETTDADDGEAEGSPEQEVKVDPEAVARALRDEKLDLLASQNEDLRKKYVELQKHSSRLASQLGRSRSEQALEMDDDQVVPSALEERLARLEESQKKEAARAAIAEEFNRFDHRPEISALNLQPELTSAVEAHQDRIRALLQISDPEEARIVAKELAVTVLSEAVSARMKASAERTTEAVVTSPVRIAARKATAVLSSTGGKRAAVRSAAPNPNTMPLDDLRSVINSMRQE